MTDRVPCLNPHCMVIHRHRFTAAEVANALGVTEDCLSIQISVEHGSLLVDIVEPGGKAVEPPAAPETPASEPQQAQEAAPSPAGPEAPAEPEKPKGGPLARRASLLCKERAFQVFLEVDTEDEARNEVCRRCLVGSRAELDHVGDAADKWNDIESSYRLWMDGYD